ncbi:hypothetical protein M8C21_011200 [Ambrosia artemisiifolia]|uniref:CCT domain-containing protein n=1 Tax=Ambrosia artemisiifolia TaxID=4212 RepID=A0AAD5CIV9_AMBAR|nr:hypothetical protein M8C21_011200 [Ambrosia artemisiifolia]
MYGHTHNNDPYSSFSPDSLTMPGSITPHAAIGYLTPTPTYELDSLCATSSGGYDSPSYSTPSMMIQRTGSSHSIASPQFHHNGLFNQPISSPTELLDFEGCNTTVRRVFSAEDLQGTNMVQCHSHRSESPISSESNSIIESMNKACRYSPDEKKERIERYRNKKSQRNFTKKIKYVCRKTLADSRPRIRGRFARNDEIEKAMEHQCTSDHGDVQEGFDEEYDGFWMTNIMDSIPPNLFP